MSWLAARQSVLAENVANADTPNFVARDMTPVDFEEMVSKANSGTADDEDQYPPHRHPHERECALHAGRRRRRSGTPSGNVVSLEQEMIKLSDTQININRHQSYQKRQHVPHRAWRSFALREGNAMDFTTSLYVAAAGMRAQSGACASSRRISPTPIRRRRRQTASLTGGASPP